MILTIKNKFSVGEKVLVECDFKFSSKCKGQFYKLYKNILKGRKNNNGKDRCQYCFNSLTKTGKNNYNFKYAKNDNFFEQIDSELKAYLLGWVAGDGCLKKDGLYISVHWIDKEILDLFRINICPSKKLKFRDYDNTLNLIINSVKIMKDLLKWLDLENFGKKSDKIKLPNLPRKLQWAFIRGLFDSDGSVISPFEQTRPECNISSTSIQMKKDLMSFFKVEDISFGFTEGYHIIIFGGANCIKMLSKIYDNSTYYLMRKKAYYAIWKTWKPGQGTLFCPRKIRKFYPKISEEHKEKIRESNRRRKKIYERDSLLCD